MIDDIENRCHEEQAHRIEKLEEEIGVLFAANVRLNSRADLDSDGYVDRIKKLEAALREIADGPRDADKSYVSLFHEIQSEAREALEGKDD